VYARSCPFACKEEHLPLRLGIDSQLGKESDPLRKRRPKQLAPARIDSATKNVNCHPEAKRGILVSAGIGNTDGAGKNQNPSLRFGMTISHRRTLRRAILQPAFRSSCALSAETSSSSHSNESARAVVSMGSSSGMSSATDAPSSANLRAETSTRLSSDPTALL
jgi:hypothetical protein